MCGWCIVSLGECGQEMWRHLEGKSAGWWQQVHVGMQFVNSRETPEGGFLKGNYTNADYAAVHNGN